MARILCNVAGGGKPLKGNAEPGDVLAGKTFSNKQSNALTGSMPNNGTWSASTSGNGSVTIPAGYHNGSGTVSGAASYKQGHDQGYNQGVSDADARVYAGSASYNAGYANGKASVSHTVRYVFKDGNSYGHCGDFALYVDGVLVWRQADPGYQEGMRRNDASAYDNRDFTYTIKG